MAKICTLCGEGEVYKHSNSWCRKCCSEHSSLWQRKNPEKVRKIKAKYFGRNADVVRERQNLYRKKRKLLVLRHYSEKEEPVCACCGENNLEFMCLDHKDGGGNKHRKTLGNPNGSGTYQWAIKHNFPDIFRVLCYNCNNSYGHYNYCPHKK